MKKLHSNLDAITKKERSLRCGFSNLLVTPVIGLENGKKSKTMTWKWIDFGSRINGKIIDKFPNQKVIYSLTQQLNFTNSRKYHHV